MSTTPHVPFSDPPERKPVIAIIAPWLIAAVVIAVGAYLFLRVTEAPPVAELKITKLFAVQQTGIDRVIVGIEVQVKNVYEKEIIVRGIDAKLVTADGKEFVDHPAGAGEDQRYYKAFPELKQSDSPPLLFDTKLQPAQQTIGLLIVGFPVTKEAFDKRKSLDVKIDFYGMKSVIVRP
jgi:hypothetical protein